jgi:hypothetical protein
MSICRILLFAGLIKALTLSASAMPISEGHDDNRSEVKNRNHDDGISDSVDPFFLRRKFFIPICGFNKAAAVIQKVFLRKRLNACGSRMPCVFWESGCLGARGFFILLLRGSAESGG